ncbi:hypothetical protein LZC95_16655 [Pendulispora brunnea]|uniref:Uncharacterized protein n=1 Tax=Pendulispora brunnea TaxID=2905690 RepID=A0ABZ2KIS2_9BACT
MSENDEQDAQEPKDSGRVRPLALSERPTPSSASVLSLANAHVPDVAAVSTPVPQAPLAPQSPQAPPPPQPPQASRPRSVPPRPEPPARPADIAAEMRDRFSLGDYTGALAAAESLLAEFPDHVEAKRCADNCRSVLEQMYAARIGPLDRIPHVAVPREKLQWLSIDHRAGFVLSHVDGVSSVQMIMAACGMPALDVLRIVHELVHSRVIAFR